MTGRHASWLRVLKGAASKWSADQASRLAASLAYFTVFSAAPLLLIAMAVAGLFLGDQAAGVIGAKLQSWLGPDKARALQGLVVAVKQPGSGLAGVVGFALLLSGAAGVVGELQTALNQIYGCETSSGGWRATVRRRLIAIAFVLALGALLLASVALQAASGWVARHAALPDLLVHGLNAALSAAVLACLFAGMFRVLPDSKPSWSDAAIGGAFTAVLFVLGNAAMGLYLSKAAAASAYGAAGALVGFLLWTYYSAQILYFGAEFTRSHADGRGRGLPAH